MLPVLLQLSFTRAESYTVALALAGLLVWVISSAGNLEKVFGWLTAGRRRREEEVERRLGELENEVRKFVGEEKLDKRFGDGEERHSKLAHLVKTLHDAQHDATGKVDSLTNDVRRSERDIKELSTLTPRVGKVESDITLLLQQMGQLREGQQEIKADLKELRDSSHDDREAIIHAIRGLKG